jgi:hypothetical protein
MEGLVLSNLLLVLELLSGRKWMLTEDQHHLSRLVGQSHFHLVMVFSLQVGS